MSKSSMGSAPFAYDGLDRVIHEKARLGLLTSLMAHPKGLAFADLKQLCGLTDGNLSRHLQVLQEAGVVSWTISPCWSGWCATPRRPRAAKARRSAGWACCRRDPAVLLPFFDL